MSVWCVLLCTGTRYHGMRLPYTCVQRSYTRTRTTRGSCSPVPRAAYLVPGTRYIPAQKQATASEVRGSVSRGKNIVSSSYYLITGVYRCYKQGNAYLMRRRRRRSAVSPWNMDPLRRTTLRGIRSARRNRGKSSALNRKSCHASVLVMLEKRCGCCRTDGPRRVRSCQMLHTIAAINAAWCRSLR